jgi:hypothetical protein
VLILTCLQKQEDEAKTFITAKVITKTLPAADTGNQAAGNTCIATGAAH